MAAPSMNLVVPGSEEHCDELCQEHCDLLLHEECVLLYRQRWLVSVADFKAALAERRDAAEELKKLAIPNATGVCNRSSGRAFLKCVVRRFQMHGRNERSF